MKACRIPNVHKWSAENPALYTVVFIIESGEAKGSTCYYAIRIGFRTVEISSCSSSISEGKGSMLLVNGVPIKLKVFTRGRVNMIYPPLFSRSFLAQAKRAVRFSYHLNCTWMCNFRE